MRDYVSIGSTPCNEDCVQVGAEDYSRLSGIECGAFIDAIKKKMGEPPGGAYLTVKSFPHDFGSYKEVCCVFDEENEAATNYAFDCEGKAPATWEEVGMQNPLLAIA